MDNEKMVPQKIPSVRVSRRLRDKESSSLLRGYSLIPSLKHACNFYQVSDPVAGAGERTEDKKKISVINGLALCFSNTKSNFITYLGPGFWTNRHASL